MAASGKQRDKYRRTCFPHEFGFVGKEYDFAEDHDSENGFLVPYEHLPYDLLEKNSFSKATVMCKMHEEICDVCKSTASDVYDICTLRRSGFLSENELSFSISFHPPTTPWRCPKCGTYSSVTGSSRESTVVLRDVRLNNMPVRMLVSRVRPMCSNENCRNLLGEQRIVGMESYASGGMTLRLTASVLACHLNGISRRYIAEAYAISPSQIDRIKARVIGMMKEASCTADLLHVIFEGIHIEREHFDITDGQDSPIELFFDYCSSSGEIKLASAYKKSTMESFQNFLRNRNPEYIYNFDSPQEFVLTGLDFYAGHCGTSGRKLLEHIAALGIYSVMMDSGGDVPMSIELRDALSSLFDAMEDGKHSLKARLNKVIKLCPDGSARSSNVLFNCIFSRSFQKLWSSINTVNAPEHLTKAERQEVKRQRKAAMKAAADLIQTQSTMSGLADTDIIDRLLRFNPAVIPSQVIDLFATVDGDDHLAENDYRSYMNRTTYGIPLACLRHLLDSGLLAEVNFH